MLLNIWLVDPIRPYMENGEYARMHKLKATQKLRCCSNRSKYTKPIRYFKCFHVSFLLLLISLLIENGSNNNDTTSDSGSDNNTRTTNDRKLMRSGKKLFEVNTHTHTHACDVMCTWERRVQIGVISRFAKPKYWKLRIDDHMVTNWCLQFVFRSFLQFIVHLRHVPI